MTTMSFVQMSHYLELVQHAPSPPHPPVHPPYTQFTQILLFAKRNENEHCGVLKDPFQMETASLVLRQLLFGMELRPEKLHRLLFIYIYLAITIPSRLPVWNDALNTVRKPTKWLNRNINIVCLFFFFKCTKFDLLRNSWSLLWGGK